MEETFEENICNMSSKEIKEIYEKCRDMRKFLDKEYKRISESDE